MDELLGTIVSAIEDKKGKNILSLDLRGFDGAVADAFVVCSAESTTQVAAIADGIEEKVFETLGQRPRRTEGMQNAICGYHGSCFPDAGPRVLPAGGALGRRPLGALRRVGVIKCG